MLLNLKQRVHDPDVRALLSEASGGFTPEKWKKMARTYREDEHRVLWGIVTDETVVGCIGIEMISPKEIVICHLSVAAAFRHRRLGSTLIESLMEMYPVKTVSAETDREAVDFYQKCGFSITSLGEKYPGVERFLCVLRT